MMDDGDGWYSYGLPLWVNRLIINANAGAIQTSDIEIEAKELWVVVDAEGTVSLSYEQPAAEATAAPIKAAEEAPVAEAKANLTWLWIAAAVVVAAGGTAGGIAIAKKKKKSA